MRKYICTFQLASLVLLQEALAFEGTFQDPNQCVPFVEYLPFSGKAAVQESDGQVVLGSYSRISPDGQFVLRSLSGSYLSVVTLMKLSMPGEKDQKAVAIETPLKSEAFPLKGSWKFLANPSGHYYKTEDIIAKGKNAKPQFKAGMTGFYTTAAELPSSDDSQIRFRSLSWPQGDIQGNDQGKGQLENKVTVVQKNSSDSFKVISETKRTYLCDNIVHSEGNIFTLPMISQDGSEFSAMPVFPANKKPTMRIYQFAQNNKDCRLVEDLNIQTSKLIFGYTNKYFKKAPVVYRGSPNHAGSTGLFVFDRDLRRTIEITDLPTPVVASDFPGMTKDGRIIFGAHWNACNSHGRCKIQAGYVRIDPFQSKSYQQAILRSGDTQKPACIRFQDISVKR